MQKSKQESGDWKPLPDEFMADVAKCSTEFGMKKSVDAPGDSDNDEVDSDIQAAASTAIKSHHGPAGGGGGGGIGGMFGGNAGAGIQQGAALGSAVGSEAASGQMSAPSAAGHAAVAKIGQAATPKAPGVASQPGQGSMGIGARKSTGCAACKAGTCQDGGHEMEKAITSRSIAIPVYMRQAAYDPDGTFRSATTQTSRMYTAIAPPVAETLAYAADSEDVRTRRAVADLKRSQEISDMRTQLLAGVRERGDRRHFGE